MISLKYRIDKIQYRKLLRGVDITVKRRDHSIPLTESEKRIYQIKIYLINNLRRQENVQDSKSKMS